MAADYRVLRARIDGLGDGDREALGFKVMEGLLPSGVGGSHVSRPMSTEAQDILSEVSLMPERDRAIIAVYISSHSRTFAASLVSARARHEELDLVIRPAITRMAGPDGEDKLAQVLRGSLPQKHN